MAGAEEQRQRDERGGSRGRGREVSPDEILDVVREVVEELEPKKRRAEKVSPDSDLGSELGLDSLARAELVQRLESRFGVTLSERVREEAESPRDLHRAVSRAKPSGAKRAAREEGAPGRRDVSPERGPEEDEAEDEAEEEAEERDVVGVADAATLLDVLDHYADREPDRRHILFLEGDPGEGSEEELTYGELRRRARGVAAALQGMGLETGQSVGLMLPTGLDYFAAFCGVLTAGGVPVPLYPPMRKSQLEDHLRRQSGILDNARVKALITFDQVKPLTRLVKAKVSGLERVVTVDDLDGDPDALQAPRVERDATAFLQYTSGSTGAPKGVILTHHNLLSNLRSMGEVLDLTGDDVIVSWLPLYHDMGLIGAWMGSLYFGVPLVLMSPLSFLSRPERWLRAIHRYRATISAAPNFAYELCLKKLSEGDEALEGLDLSSWRMALNGAEPVSPRSVERFPERFGSYGFRREAVMPVYGLAESSLAVSFTPPGREPKIDVVDREAFQKERRAEPAGEDAENPLRFVSCGRPIPHHEVRFVDPDGREVGEREEGRLQFRGPSATSGYFRNPEATDRLIRDEWYDSEDLGYSAEGEVYVTGRSKDVIIRAGRNIYPQEVEDAVGDIEGVRRGCVAVFATEDEEGGTEKLVVMAETRYEEEDEEERSELTERIEGTTMDLVGTDPDRVVLVPPRTVPKTSSGKIRRSAAREMYEKGDLDASTRAVWWQVTRLALSGVRPWLRSQWRRLGGVAYAVWFWGLFGLVAVPIWLAVWGLPFLGLRRRFVRWAARGVAAATGTQIRAEGLEHLEKGGDGPRVITANHASYLDGFVLATVLPPDAAYVVKSELRDNPFAHLFLRRIGCVFVERYDAARGERESSKGAEAIGRGDSLVIFPEGTLQRAPGLQPFRNGAFVVAARTGTPVVPVAIRGTRSKLRGGTWFPRPGDVTVVVRSPVEPEGEGWEAAMALRRRVREEILDALPEPDLQSN